jgi:hypothetical protein
VSVREEIPNPRMGSYFATAGRRQSPGRERKKDYLRESQTRDGDAGTKGDGKTVNSPTKATEASWNVSFLFQHCEKEVHGSLTVRRKENYRVTLRRCGSCWTVSCVERYTSDRHGPDIAKRVFLERNVALVVLSSLLGRDGPDGPARGL